MIVEISFQILCLVDQRMNQKLGSTKMSNISFNFLMMVYHLNHPCTDSDEIGQRIIRKKIMTEKYSHNWSILDWS
jgi:hypothetical protein